MFLTLQASSALAVLQPSLLPALRLEGEAARLKFAPKTKRLAYTEPSGRGLAIVDTKNGQVVLVSKELVGPSFFWSPDGYRLFYRELKGTIEGEIHSSLKAYDISLNKAVTVAEVAGSTGYLSFDPRDLRFQLTTPTGIQSHRIHFPDARLAKWQAQARTEFGKWLATPKGMFWLSYGGLAMAKLADDNSGIQAFAISAHGDYAAWSTKDGQLYISENGGSPRRVGLGRDPAWHPDKPLLVYAATQKLGNTEVGSELRITDPAGQGRMLTRTDISSERWPTWGENGRSLYYTIHGSTDIFRLDLKE